MYASPFFVSQSPLLGDRAGKVYEWFLRSLGVEGDIAECGVFSGITSYEFARYIEAMRIPKCVHMFDTFRGIPDIVKSTERGTASGGPLPGKFSCDLATVSAQMRSRTQYELHPGLFSTTFPQFKRKLCFIHADADLYESTIQIIKFADRCLSDGGVMVFDDYEHEYYPGVKLAIQDALDASRYKVIPSPESFQCFAVRARL